jgi:hypothetical protein
MGNGIGRSVSATATKTTSKTNTFSTDLNRAFGGWAGAFWPNHILHAWLVFALSSLIYVNTVGFEYAMDDAVVITANRYTKKGWNGLKGIWTKDSFAGLFGDNTNFVAGGRYRPLSITTFILEMELLGEVERAPNGRILQDMDGDPILKGNPYVSHGVNVLMYGLMCVALYWLVLLMFNPNRDPENLKGNFIAVITTLLYATHPLHTEVVANIKGRDELMVMFGAILAAYWTLKATLTDDQKAIRKYTALAIIAYLAGIFSKESAITFLAVIPAATYVFFPQVPVRTIIARNLPLVVVSVIFWFAIRRNVLGVGIGTPPPELMNDPFLKFDMANNYVPFTTAERLATILYTWFEYLRLLVWPHPLTCDYYPKHVPDYADQRNQHP